MTTHWMTQRKALLKAGASILDQLAGSNSDQYPLAWRTWGEVLLTNDGWARTSIAHAALLLEERDVDMVYHNLRTREQMWVKSIIHVTGSHYKLIDVDGKLVHLNSEIDYVMGKERRKKKDGEVLGKS